MPPGLNYGDTPVTKYLLKQLIFNSRDYHYVSQGKIKVDSIDDKVSKVFAKSGTKTVIFCTGGHAVCR